MQKTKDDFQEDLNSKLELIDMLKNEVKKENNSNLLLWEKLNGLEKQNEAMQLKLDVEKIDASTNTEDQFLPNLFIKTEDFIEILD